MSFKNWKIKDWLKNIFSVTTIGIVLTALGLLINYLVFRQATPGDLNLTIGKNRVDKNVTIIYVLTPVGDKGVDFMVNCDMPVFANFDQRPVLDCTFIMEFYSKNSFISYPEYMYKVDSTKASKPYVEMAKKVDTIGYMGGELFPLMSMSASSIEPQITTFGWTYIHRGMDDPITYNIRLVSVPERFLDNGNPDYSFLKILRPELLAEKSLKKVAIYYNGVLIQNPKHVKRLGDNNIKDLRLSDIQ